MGYVVGVAIIVLFTVIAVLEACFALYHGGAQGAPLFTSTGEGFGEGPKRARWEEQAALAAARVAETAGCLSVRGRRRDRRLGWPRGVRRVWPARGRFLLASPPPASFPSQPIPSSSSSPASPSPPAPAESPVSAAARAPSAAHPPSPPPLSPACRPPLAPPGLSLLRKVRRPSPAPALPLTRPRPAAR